MDFLASDNASDTHERGITGPPWVVLLVDDDKEVHQITRLALAQFVFKGRKLELISAYTGIEAKSILESRDDIAMALIDVVMESDHAGLDLVRCIRNELNNQMTRLVLRTGQAGVAPEDTVIREYEIDDYKEKTELTTQKLRTLLYSMLRAYSELCAISEQRKKLGKIIEASAVVQSTTSLKEYATTVLHQFSSLFEIDISALYALVPYRHGMDETRAISLIATKSTVDITPYSSLFFLPEKVAKRCQEVLENKKVEQYADACIFYNPNESKLSSLLYIDMDGTISDLDRRLLDIYIHNIALTFENLNLMRDLQETSKELVYNLANAVEVRSKETGAHVQRVAGYIEIITRHYGVEEQEALLIQNASPLHDIGKVAIPDKILHKPGKLDAGEWSEMQKHVDYGVEILSKSKRHLLKIAAEIAGTHHEKWEGSGYPNHLRGKEIPLSGRIAALADVFDALSSRRSYKEPWSDDAIKAELLAQKGKHFDPELVDIALEHWEEFLSVRESYPD
ncbi:DUF3369 domain-containing protein [Vibrio sp. JC009]|uniref:HD domain-containing phosphohydrolase n=1 Tax=Vibrio sp. JC009 TaxID=2912314 RepID=UPI0023AF60A4|nr:HD domain-containing phosphohydrolase [Vibrio sp. JC009]WED24545.1 DUF3369 domain-containing protein [Vibrio sp. JC009]